MSAITEIVTNVSKQIRDKFELEDSFIKDIEGIVSSCLDKYNVSKTQPTAPVAEKKKRASKKDATASEPKAPKKSSGYNMFVTEMMKTPEISALPHKERMGQIGAKWKNASDEEKKKYTDMAVEKNKASTTTA